MYKNMTNYEKQLPSGGGGGVGDPTTRVEAGTKLVSERWGGSQYIATDPSHVHGSIHLVSMAPPPPL